jgi:GNAT superfamily N-acetyltransferase
LIDASVRRAVPGDAAILGMLESSARAALADARGGLRWLDAHAEIGDSWSRAIEQRTVFVAAIQSDGDADGADAVVGYLVADLVEDPMLVARIDQVFVDEAARELGFGDALVDAAMEWGRESGAELIEAETLPGDRNLKNLYERAGVTARLITVSKRLSGGRQEPLPPAPPADRSTSD